LRLSKLPVISGRDLVRILGRFGFVLDRQKGSHMIMVRTDPMTTLTVPDHRELDRGTLRAILRQADITPQQLVGAL
jgi:predicted RNA binding protein YcfA (HicA-like mRNA interferase family)